MQTPRWHLHSLSVAYLLILTSLESYIYCNGSDKGEQISREQKSRKQRERICRFNERKKGRIDGYPKRDFKQF